MLNKRLLTQTPDKYFKSTVFSPEQQQNDTIVKASAQRLKNFHKNYCMRLYSQKIQKLETDSFQLKRKFRILPEGTQVGESMEISNYLEMVRKQKSNKKYLSVVIPEIVKSRRHTNPKNSVPLLHLSKYKIKRKQWGRRNAITINPPAHEFLRINKIYELVTQIVSFYEEFGKLGISQNKLINIIANCCHEKNYLNEIFRQKVPGQNDTYINYIKEAEQIIIKMKQYSLQFTQKELKQLMRNVTIYKNEITQIYNEHIRIRLNEIQKSIIKMRQRGIYKMIPLLEINPMDASNIMDNLTRVEEKNGEFKLISNTNRYLYNCLNMVENNLKSIESKN